MDKVQKHNSFNKNNIFEYMSSRLLSREIKTKIYIFIIALTSCFLWVSDLVCHEEERTWIEDV
jgi:hypothetical protein